MCLKTDPTHPDPQVRTHSHPVVEFMKWFLPRAIRDRVTQDIYADIADMRAQRRTEVRITIHVLWHLFINFVVDLKERLGRQNKK